MVSLTILYPSQSGGVFDFDYYCNVHLANVARLLGNTLVGLTVEEGGGESMAPGSPAFVAIGRLFFASRESYESAFVPRADEFKAGIPRFTNITPVFQFSDLRLARWPGP